MLIETGGGAFYDLDIFDMLEKAADKGILGNKTFYFRKNGKTGILLCESFTESGAVEIIDFGDAELDWVGGENGGVHGDVAAFGVAAESEFFPGIFADDVAEIAERLFLGGNLFHKRHIKIFAPTKKRFVGAEIGDEKLVVVEVDGDGRKLFGDFLVVFANVIGHAEIAKALTAAEIFDKFFVVGPEEVVGGKRFHFFGDATDGFDFVHFDAVENKVGEPREDDCIDVIERSDFRDAQVAAPNKVVVYVRHFWLQLRDF